MPNPDKRYGVAVRLSDDAARNKPAKKGFFSHFATLPRKKKNQDVDMKNVHRPVTPSQAKNRNANNATWNRFDTQKSRSQSLPRNIRTEDLERNDSDMSYDPLERSIFQRARQTSQEVDRQTRQGRQVEKRSGNSTPRFNRPRSVGATLNRSGHLSGSDGNRYHSNISSSGPDTDRRTDNESYDRRRTINRAGGARRNVEYVSVTNVSRDGTIGNTSMLRMDDKNGETRIDEMSSGKEIKRQLIRAMKELKDLGSVARVIDEIDDEQWLLMFVQELEVQVKQIIQIERKIKQLIHQAREGRTDSYNELIKGMTVQLKSKKQTLLDCLNDILSYFHDRLRSKDTRTFKSKHVHGMLKAMSDAEGASESSEYGTFGRINRRLKKLALNRPEVLQGNQSKWQFELQRVSRTVDEYLRMAMPPTMSGSEMNDSMSSMGTLPRQAGTLNRASPANGSGHVRQNSGFSSDDFGRNNSTFSSQTLDRRRGRPQRGGWDPNRSRSLERGKKGEMDSNLRNADSGLDLDDSGSGGDTFRPESRGGGTHSARGRPRERASIKLYVTTSSDDDGGYRANQRLREQPTELQRKTEETKQMKKHLEKLQREIQETRSSKSDKERQLNQERTRIQKMQRAMANGLSEKAELEAELMRLREQLRSGENGRSRNVVTLQSRLSEMSQRIHDDKREIDFASEKVAQLTAELNGNRRTSERLERAKHELEEQLNQLTIQLMAERKELRSLQMENLRLENQLSEASSRLETETERSKKTENDLQKEMSKLIDSLKDEQNKNRTLKKKGGSAGREMKSLQAQVEGQKEKLNELQSENMELQSHKRKLQELLNGEKQFTSSTLDCIKKELEYTTQELQISRDAVQNQKQEFEKEIQRLLFDNREIKDQSRKTQRELSKEINSLTDELKDERDRIHELQKENRKLRQENIELQTKLTKLENTRGRIRPENVVDNGTQVEDNSFTRKRAFDFYIDEVQRDAHKLLERGRNMEREVNAKAMEAEKRVVSQSSAATSPMSPPSTRRAQPPPSNEPPSATSNTKRKFSFKKLSMTKK